jgi:hypothetical protein
LPFYFLLLPSFLLCVEIYLVEFAGGRLGLGRGDGELPMPYHKATLPMTAIRKIKATITIRIAIFTVLRIIKKATAATAAKARKNTTANPTPTTEVLVSESATSNKNIKLILNLQHLPKKKNYSADL